MYRSCLTVAPCTAARCARILSSVVLPEPLFDFLAGMYDVLEVYTPRSHQRDHLSGFNDAIDVG